MNIEIHNRATAAAQEAAAEMYKKIGGDQGACGFAWVTVYGVKLSTKLGKEFAKHGFTKEYGGGISLWNPSGSRVQNIDIKEAGARAYASVLQEAGFEAYANSRMD
jgi:O-acetyl-ADP-ribose deacetylase (regulator of RNase III)